MGSERPARASRTAQSCRADHAARSEAPTVRGRSRSSNGPRPPRLGLARGLSRSPLLPGRASFGEPSRGGTPGRATAAVASRSRCSRRMEASTMRWPLPLCASPVCRAKHAAQPSCSALLCSVQQLRSATHLKCAAKLLDSAAQQKLRSLVFSAKLLG